MSPKLHRWLPLLVVLVAPAASLASPAPSTGRTALSFVHAIPGPDGFPLDVKLNDTCLEDRFRFGEIEDADHVAAGTYAVTLYALPAVQRKSSGSPGSGPAEHEDEDADCSGAVLLGPVTVTLLPGENVSLVAHLSADGSTYELTKFVNDLSPTAPGRTRVVAHHVAAAGAVDVEIGRRGASPPAVTTTLSGLVNGDRQSAEVPPGRRVIALLDAGTTTELIAPLDLVLKPFDILRIYVVGSETDGTLAWIVDTPDDSKRTGCVYHPDSGTWYRPRHGGKTDSFQYGFRGTIPVRGDWDGDGIAGIGIYDPSTGTWYLRNSNTPGQPDLVIHFGFPGALPVVGDWNGDGLATIGVYYPANGTWYLRNSNTAGAPDLVVTYGFPGTLPVVGDWDGDGHEGIGVYYPTSGGWYLRDQVGPGAPDHAFQFGFPGTQPYVGDWDAEGHEGIGVYHPDSGRWYLRRDVSPGAPDDVIEYGFRGTRASD